MKNYLISLLFVIVSFATAAAQAPVTIRESVDNYVMENGIIETVISRKSGSIMSIKYLGKDLLVPRDSGPSAMWSHDATSADMIYKVTIDPAKNNGERGEISIKGISGGKPMGNGPGGSFIADIEVRYAMEKGQPGIYTYSIFDHLPDYPASSMGEARYVAFLQSGFDWMSVDEKRSRLYRIKQNELDLSKYQYTSNLHENPAFGWIDTSANVGFWLINASMEYMSGGPTKVDFLCHRDTRINGAPVFLNYWRSSHYGGSSVEVTAGEKWAKMIGPIFLYANKGGAIDTIKKDALARQVAEKNKFPYSWVNAPEFPLKEQRGTVSGKLVLKDPITPKKFDRLRVGLTAPDYPVSQPNTTEKRIVDWQYDAKNYQFWTVGNAKGEFKIENIRPGKYTLHAIADGVLGEYAGREITVDGGKKLDLGSLEWVPVRRGRQIWEIGINNRTSSEFLGGDRYYEPDVLKRYPGYFPQDVNFTIGKSDIAKDWYYAQIPHVDKYEATENNVMPQASQDAFFRMVGAAANAPEIRQSVLEMITTMGGSGRYAAGRATPWTVNFDLPAELKGNAVLRLAICGTGTREVEIRVNGKDAGKLQNLRIDGTPNRHGNHGLWYEREVEIDRSLFQKGANTVQLIIPSGQVVNGIMYDYLRLEEKNR